MIITSALFITIFPGVAKAAPSDTTIHPIVCATPVETIYLAYGINSVTITNPNGCSGTNNFYLAYGTGATWTYSQTIGGVTTSAPYVPNPADDLLISTIGSADSFTLTLTSASDVYVILGSMDRQLTIVFNKQINTLSPDPVAIGQQATVTGSNLSSVSSLLFYDEDMNQFTATTSNRTATQFTFTVPLTPIGTYNLMSHEGKTLTIIAAPTITAPGAPIIGTTTAVSPTSASIAFVAPASDGGATIETYTATSSPGSITSRVLQAGSGTITMTGLTSSTAYTFTVTASNSVGTSSASSSSVSITTPASAEEIAAQNAAAVSAAKAAASAAVLQREVMKRNARDAILSRFKKSENTSLEIFNYAEISGITTENIEAVQAEIFAIPMESRIDLNQVLKIARKYEVLAIIASDRVKRILPISLIEAGLISAESKNKATLTTVVRRLPASERSSYAAIKKAIDAKMAEIQAREDRQKAVLARIASRRAL